MSGGCRLKLLYFCEGFTDIRFLVGLSEIADLTLATPARAFHASGLARRLEESGAEIGVHELEGGRLAFQARAFGYLVREMRRYDVVIAQEMVRGALSATLAGRLTGVPVATYMGISPVEYFRCRRERGTIGPVTAAAGEMFIRAAMTVNGTLASAAIAMGPYLTALASRYSRRSVMGGYYGVDERLFRPVCDDCRRALRRRHAMPEDAFIVFFPSRISHEKDPETLLRAVARVRAGGLDAVVVNLGGGFREFVHLADELGLGDAAAWVIGRPAVHPMGDLCEYFQLADLVVQSSRAEGFGLSPLEALACGTPVVATRVGGMAAHLDGYAQLTPPHDVESMARAIAWVAEHRHEAREQAGRGREYVHERWERSRVFADLKDVLESVARAH